MISMVHLFVRGSEAVDDVTGGGGKVNTLLKNINQDYTEFSARCRGRLSPEALSAPQAPDRLSLSAAGPGSSFGMDMLIQTRMDESQQLDEDGKLQHMVFERDEVARRHQPGNHTFYPTQVCVCLSY